MKSSHTLSAPHSSHSSPASHIPAVGTVSIHPCSEGDVEAIQAIYAHYVATNLATFELEPPTAQQMLSRRADI
ncbi:MAG: hypothetical protein ABIP46_03090, partial [Polaromonas sp.]